MASGRITLGGLEKMHQRRRIKYFDRSDSSSGMYYHMFSMIGIDNGFAAQHETNLNWVLGKRYGDVSKVGDVPCVCLKGSEAYKRAESLLRGNAVSRIFNETVRSTMRGMQG